MISLHFMAILCFFIKILVNNNIPVEAKEEKVSVPEVEIVRGRKRINTANMMMQLSLYDPYLIFNNPNIAWRASATILGEMSDDKIAGTIMFHQWTSNNLVKIIVNITGLPPGKHAVHIHTFGDVSIGCKAAGPHFPSNYIGNIIAGEDGTVSTSFFSSFLTLFGVNGIIGRSVVIHANPIAFDRYQDVYSSSLYIIPGHPLSFNSEESTVGAIIACGSLMITDNAM